MKLNKILSVLLACVMVLGLLVGCGKDAANQTPNAGTTETQAQADGENKAPEATAPTGEVYNIEMQIVTWGGVPDEIADVEAAINAITEPEIGVTVTLNPIAAWDLINESNMTVTAGEKLDLLCVFVFGQAMDSVANYTSKNMLIPLDELYATYGTDIAAVLGDTVSLGYVGGTLYAVPCTAPLGNGAGFAARKDYLDEMGVEIDTNKLYTVEELGEIFQKFVDTYGQGYYPISVFGSGTDMYDKLFPIETLGGSANNGVLLNAGLDGNTTVTNLFETDEYAKYCDIVHGWYQNGYINPDVNTISDDVTSQMKSGKYLGSFGTLIPGDTVGMSNTLDVELVNIPVVAPYASTTAASQALWAIPATCENPEKVMQFLNLLYQERELANDIDSILAHGVEGISYNVVETIGGSKAIIEGIPGAEGGSGSWGQWVPSSLFGNSMTVPKSVPNTAAIYDELDAYNSQIMSEGRITDAFGYVFDPSPVSAQVAGVTSVASQYRGLVGFGAADPAEVLPEFIEALKDAGIDEIIAENQKQLDAWLATK